MSQQALEPMRAMPSAGRARELPSLPVPTKSASGWASATSQSAAGTVEAVVGDGVEGSVRRGLHVTVGGRAVDLDAPHDGAAVEKRGREGH